MAYPEAMKKSAEMVIDIFFSIEVFAASILTQGDVWHVLYCESFSSSLHFLRSGFSGHVFW